MNETTTTTTERRDFGHVFRRGAIYWIRYSVGGRRYRESTHSADVREAEKLLAVRRAEHRADVYAIRCGMSGRVKIGSSLDVARRLRELQAASPTSLEAVAVIRRGGRLLEARLHDQYGTYRLDGEWFAPEVARLFVREAAERRTP